MKQFLLWITVVLLCSGILSSCASGPELQQDDPVFPAEASTALLMDEALVSVIEIQDQGVSRDENGVILAQTLIRNKTGDPVRLDVRCLFKDQLGVTQEASPWKEISIPAQGRQIYVAPSLNRYATRFIVQIRLPDNQE